MHLLPFVRSPPPILSGRPYPYQKDTVNSSVSPRMHFGRFQFMGKFSLIIFVTVFFEFVIFSSQVTCLAKSLQLPHTFLALKTTKGAANSKKHFVLVHGAGHGAWCWYKLTALLERAGHDVTVMDLAGCGINPKQRNEVNSLQDYVEPLMEVMGSVPEGEKVVLVGHSFGGFAVAFAMEAFAEKISVAVAVAAVLIPPNSTLYEYYSQPQPPPSEPQCMYDTKYFYDDGPEHGPTAVIFGPQMLAHRLYQQCPLEDLKLAAVLLRETRIFTKENTKDARFTMERYGSVPRVFVICEEDRLSNKEGQQSMIEKGGVDEVHVIEGADHMVMLSKPQELFNYLLEVADKYNA